MSHHSVKSQKSLPLDTCSGSWTVLAMAYTRFEWEKAIGDCEELSPNAHHTALTLGNWIHSHRLEGFVTQEDIARRMKRSRKHVNRGLKELETSGWLHRTPGVQGRATVYRQDVSWGPPLVSMTVESGRDARVDLRRDTRWV